jgi:hypothetical protein
MSMVKMVEAELKTEVREEVESNLLFTCLPDPDVNGEDGGGGFEDGGEGGGRSNLLFTCLPDPDVNGEDGGGGVEDRLREEVESNFLLT